MVWAIEGYEHVARVGGGSTGVVMSAREAATGAVVAVKYLSPELAGSAAFVVRYRGEAAMLGLIEDPHLANVYEFVERGATAAIVTELVDGVSLRAILEHTGRLEPQAALYIVKGALLGLREVHSRGILHRALKPENVLVNVDGQAKIVDVGLTPPSRDRIPANPIYAAPELWSGGQPTRMCDVYAATAILFECLSGQPPMGLGGAHLGRSGQPADTAIAAIPMEYAPHQLRAFLALGLGVDPQARPFDAHAALQQLDIAAFSAFGSTWYDTGRALLMRKLAQALVAVRDTTQSQRPVVPAAPPSQRPVEARPTITAQPSLRYPTLRPSSPAAPSVTVVPAATGRPVTRPRPARFNRLTRVLVAVAALLLVTAGTAYAVMSGLRHDAALPAVAATNSHVPMVVSGPAVPIPTETGPGADVTKPAKPAGLHITGRSVMGVSLDWAEATDNVKVAGYIVLRDRSRVGTTFGPGFTDTGLHARKSYQYAVAAFDAAGNISATSVPVTATTLTEPDVSPPAVPANVHATGMSTTSIVLAWSASHDNIGVAGYEVFRDGGLIANVAQPGYTDIGLEAATSHSYKVRAFDTSNNASGDSDTITASTLAAPDTTPPSVPGGVGAIGTSPSTIDISWTASADNVGVTSYLVYRDGGQITEVLGTSFTDQGLSPSTSYTYTVREVDAAANQSVLSGAATASTTPAPTTPPPTVDPTTPPPTTDPPPVIMSVSLNTTILDCVATVEATVMASAPMDVVLDYTITGPGTGSIPISFTAGNLSWTQVIATNGDATIDGGATASAGGQSAIPAGWTACVPTAPPTI